MKSLFEEHGGKYIQCGDYLIPDLGLWKGIAEIEHYHGGNVNQVLYAKSVMKQEQRRDFQRRHRR